MSLAGRQTPEFVVDGFDVSYGDPQTVAVTARRDQHNRRLDYRVNGGPVQRPASASGRAASATAASATATTPSSGAR